MYALAEPLESADIRQDAPAPAICFGDLTGHAETQEPLPKVDWRRDATLIDSYLAHTADAIQTDAALTIVDLAPGDGERAWQLLRVLHRPLRYLAVGASAAQCEALHGHPALQAVLADGRLEVHLRPDHATEWQFCAGSNPLIILAHGIFSRWRQDLYGCHYGAWLSGKVDMHTNTLEWPAHTTQDAFGMALAPVYLRSLNSTALLLPSGAATILEALSRIAQGRYLLLASDIGTHQISDIRLGALAASPEAARATRLPVNFHALSIWQEMQGAHCCTLQTADPETPVWHIAVRDDAHPVGHTVQNALHASWHKVNSEMGLRHFAPWFAAQSELGNLDAAQAFVLWQSSGYAPALMLALQTPLFEHASTQEGAALELWRSALRECGAQYFPAPQDDGVYRAAACLASAINAWQLALEFLEAEQHCYAPRPDNLRLSAYCLRMLGRLDEALVTLRAARAQAPRDTRITQDWRNLKDVLCRRKRLTWYASHLAVGHDLCIEPLGTEHAEAFFYQYRDPQIGMMARLPEFKTAEDTAEWIATRGQEAGRMEFALLHAEFGFAGVVSAHRVGSSAFFHFWLGADFQGQGLALPAFELLRAQLEAIGIKRIFTAVYPDNFRSLRVLERCGFQAMPDRALPPEDNMPFFCLELGDLSSSAQKNSAALRQYSAKSGGVFVFAADRKND